MITFVAIALLPLLLFWVLLVLGMKRMLYKLKLYFNSSGYSAPLNFSSEKMARLWDIQPEETERVHQVL